MALNGSRRVFQGSRWVLWFFMVPGRFFRAPGRFFIVPGGFYGFPWFQVDFFGFSWFQAGFSMIPAQFFISHEGFYGFSWFQVFFMVSGQFLWVSRFRLVFMVLGGFP